MDWERLTKTYNEADFEHLARSQSAVEFALSAMRNGTCPRFKEIYSKLRRTFLPDFIEWLVDRNRKTEVGNE